MSASSRLDLNKNQDRNDETRNEKNFEDGDFPALRRIYYRRTQAQYMVTGHNTPHKKLPEYATDGIETQNDPLQQQVTKPQSIAIHISPDNTLPMVRKSPQSRISDSGNFINRLFEAIAGIAPQQRHQKSSPIFN